MTEEQFVQLSKLIYKNFDLFATELTDLVGTDIVTHNIDMGDSPPIRKRPYKLQAQPTNYTGAEEKGPGVTGRGHN